MQVTHLLFDLDGTLTDPAEGITKSIAFALEKMGIPVANRLELANYIGPPLDGTFAELGVPEAKIEQAIAAYREYFAKQGMYENEIYAGITALLATVSAIVPQVMLVTSKPTFFAEKILHHFEIATYFSAIHGCELDGVRANKVELMKYVLDLHQINPAQAVMIGDRKFDMSAANAYGVQAVGVTYGFGSVQELQLAGAQQIVHTVPELEALLLEWLKR